MASDRSFSRRIARALLLSLAVSTSLVAVSVSAAEPDETAKKAARNFMTEGRDLRDHKDLKGALEAFKKADAIMGVPSTGIEVARTLRQLGQLREAKKIATEIASSEVKPKEPAPFAVARDEAKQLLAELEKAMPVISIKVKGAAKPEIRVDDALVVDPSHVEVDPGEHKVQARGPKDTKSATVTLAEGEKKDLSFDLSPPAEPKEPAPPKEPVEGKVKPSSGKGTLAAVGFGLGGAGLLVGAVTGFMAKGKASTAKDACVDSRCPPSVHGDIDSGKRLATFSNIGFAVAVVGAGVGTYAILSKPKKEKSEDTAGRWLSPYIGVGSAGVTGAF